MEETRTVERRKTSLGPISLFEVSGPPGPKRPLVLLFHGGGGSKKDVLPLAEALASEGCFCVCPDLYRHGDRAEPGKPLFSLSLFVRVVRETGRLLARYRAHAEVDPARVGMVGESIGGLVIYHYLRSHPGAAKAVATVASTPAWRDFSMADAVSLMTRFLSDRGAERIDLGPTGRLSEAALSLLSPDRRPERLFESSILLLNGALDPIVKIEGVRRFAETAGKRAADVTLIEYPELGHAFHPGMKDETLSFFRAKL